MKKLIGLMLLVVVLAPLAGAAEKGFPMYAMKDRDLSIPMSDMISNTEEKFPMKRVIIHEVSTETETHTVFEVKRGVNLAHQAVKSKTVLAENPVRKRSKIEPMKASTIFILGLATFLVLGLGVFVPGAWAGDHGASLHSTTDEEMEVSVKDRVSERTFAERSDPAEKYGLSDDVQARVDNLFESMQPIDKKSGIENKVAEKTDVKPHAVYQVTKPQPHLAGKLKLSNEEIAASMFDDLKQ